MRAAKVLCRTGADAEDAVSETILEAVKGYGGFRGNSSATTWMYTILLRVVSAGKRRGDETVALGEEAAERPDGRPAPEDAAAGDEESRAVIRAIRSLPPRQREIVTLYCIENLTYAEVAEALGVSTGTVKDSMFKAKKALRRSLSAMGVEREGPNGLPRRS